MTRLRAVAFQERFCAWRDGQCPLPWSRSQVSLAAAPRFSTESHLVQGRYRPKTVSFLVQIRVMYSAIGSTKMQTLLSPRLIQQTAKHQRGIAPARRDSQNRPGISRRRPRLIVVKVPPKPLLVGKSGNTHNHRVLYLPDKKTKESQPPSQLISRWHRR